jgi:hypothetical protein
MIMKDDSAANCLISVITTIVHKRGDISLQR